jgi:hypothetical protein
MICSLVSRGDLWPDTNIMQMVKHNKEMDSFVVKVKATSVCTKILTVKTMHSRSFGRKM